MYSGQLVPFACCLHSITAFLLFFFVVCLVFFPCYCKCLHSNIIYVTFQSLCKSNFKNPLKYIV